MKPTFEVRAGDIMALISCKGSEANEIASVCNHLRRRRKIAVWELSYDERSQKLYFDGWNADDKETCHEWVG